MDKQVRVVFDYDEYADPFDSDDFQDNEEDYKRIGEMYKDGEPIPFEEYRRYWGDPDMHVYLVATLEAKCECCGSWKTVGSLGGIDCMVDDNYQTGKFEEAEFGRLHEYLKEVATELVAEYRA